MDIELKTDREILISIQTNQEAICREIKEIKEKQRCDVHREKILTHEKMLWGAVLASIGAVIKSFWPGSGT